MLTILTAATWLVVLIVVVGTCRIAAGADEVVEEPILGRGSETEPILEGGRASQDAAEILLLPSNPV